MEPNDLKSPTPPDDAHLDAWLRTNAALPPLSDDGFSRCVLTALPAPQRSGQQSPRMLAIAAGAAAGIGLAAFRFWTGTPDDFSLPLFGPEAADTFAKLTDPKLHAALGVTVGTLAFAFWRDLRQLMGL